MIYMYRYRHTTLWELIMDMPSIDFESVEFDTDLRSNDTRPVKVAIKPNIEKLKACLALMGERKRVEWLLKADPDLLMFIEADNSFESPADIADTDYFIFYKRNL